MDAALRRAQAVSSMPGRQGDFVFCAAQELQSEARENEIFYASTLVSCSSDLCSPTILTVMYAWNYGAFDQCCSGEYRRSNQLDLPVLVSVKEQKDVQGRLPGCAEGCSGIDRLQTERHLLQINPTVAHKLRLPHQRKNALKMMDS